MNESRRATQCPAEMDADVCFLFVLCVKSECIGQYVERKAAADKAVRPCIPYMGNATDVLLLLVGTYDDIRCI